MPAPNSNNVPGLNVVPLGELGTEPWKGATGGVNKPAGASSAVVSAPTGTVSWLTHPEAWKVVKAAGVTSPGLVILDKISGFEREQKWDAKGGKSTTGATLTRTEEPLIEGSFTFGLWMDQHADDWAKWLAIWRYNAATKTGDAVALYHPSLASLQPPMTSAVMTKHTRIQPDAKGYAEVTIYLKETRPSKAVGSSTAKGATQYYQVGKSGPGAGTTGAGGQEDPAVTKLQKQAAALAAQAAALA